MSAISGVCQAIPSYESKGETLSSEYLKFLQSDDISYKRLWEIRDFIPQDNQLFLSDPFADTLIKCREHFECFLYDLFKDEINKQTITKEFKSFLQLEQNKLNQPKKYHLHIFVALSNYCELIEDFFRDLIKNEFSRRIDFNLISLEKIQFMAYLNSMELENINLPKAFSDFECSSSLLTEIRQELTYLGIAMPVESELGSILTRYLESSVYSSQQILDFLTDLSTCIQKYELEDSDFSVLFYKTHQLCKEILTEKIDSDLLESSSIFNDHNFYNIPALDARKLQVQNALSYHEENSKDASLELSDGLESIWHSWAETCKSIYFSETLLPIELQACRKLSLELCITELMPYLNDSIKRKHPPLYFKINELRKIIENELDRLNPDSTVSQICSSISISYDELSDYVYYFYQKQNLDVLNAEKTKIEEKLESIQNEPDEFDPEDQKLSEQELNFISSTIEAMNFEENNFYEQIQDCLSNSERNQLHEFVAEILLSKISISETIPLMNAPVSVEDMNLCLKAIDSHLLAFNSELFFSKQVVSELFTFIISLNFSEDIASKIEEALQSVDIYFIQNNENADPKALFFGILSSYEVTTDQQREIEKKINEQCLWNNVGHLFTTPYPTDLIYTIRSLLAQIKRFPSDFLSTAINYNPVDFDILIDQIELKKFDVLSKQYHSMVEQISRKLYSSLDELRALQATRHFLKSHTIEYQIDLFKENLNIYNFLHKLLTCRNSKLEPKKEESKQIFKNHLEMVQI